MSLMEKINHDLKEAMKARDSDRTDTLRMLKAAILNAAIAQKVQDLADPEILATLQKQAKQRRESIDQFEKAGRVELLAKEKRELVILEAYLPKQLSDPDLAVLVQAAVKEAGAVSKAETGKVMKILMPRVKGQADGKRINEVLATILK
ncbi:MAG: GatB/YqeY domain-containing protein [Candidatus Omnitrophota bacterium]